MIVRLQGGLGNQCFQVAYGLSQAAKRAEEIFFDRSRIVAPRSYALEPFNLSLKFKDNAPDAEVGYWQSEKWFDPQVGRLFDAPKCEDTRLFANIVHGFGMRPAVAVHIRLTDNLSPRALAFHGNLLDTDYYQRAFDWMGELYGYVEFYVFSDDAAWCERNLNWQNVTVVPTLNEASDLWKMSLFENIIIANSSYSWWSAWLGKRSKTVIAPKRWFVVPVEGSEDIVPDRWKKL